MKIMNNKKLIGILEGILTIVLGVLIAIFGIGTLDLYFGIVFVAMAALFLVVSIVALAKTGVLPFGAVLAFTTLLTFGIFILTNRLSVGYVIYLLVIFVIAAGGALVFYGAYSAAKINLAYGIGQIVLGALAVVAAVLYLTVPEFYRAFWIIVGVLVALYGVLVLVEALTDKKLLKK